MSIDHNSLVNLSAQCLVRKHKHRKSSREYRLSGKVSMSLTVVYANSSRCVIATHLLLSFILCCVFRPDLQLNLTTKLNSKRKKAISVLYAPDILNSPQKSVNFPLAPCHPNPNLPSSTSYYRRRRNLISISQTINS